MDKRYRNDEEAFDRCLGRVIRRRRRALDMSQTDLAQRFGVTFKAVMAYERSHVRIATSRLLTLADALDTSPLTLMQEAMADYRAPIFRDDAA